MSDPTRHQKDKEAAAKLALKRVQNVEKHFGEICSTLGSITRKSARLRDKGDLLARNLISLAEAENVNSSMHTNVLQFAENYAAVQDYCHAQVQRLEAKVLKPLTKYGEKCRYVKRGIKSEISACGKEKKVAEKLQKLQEKSVNQSQIAQLELELEKVQGEEQLVGEAMEMEVDKFEREKLLDIKSVLTELVKVEMLYHAKALEFLSRCYENTQSMDVEADMDEYRRTMIKVAKSGPGNNNARSQKIRMDAATLTTTGSTSRSSDTRASGTLTGSTLSSTGHSSQQLTQRSQASVQRRLSQNVQPSPRSRQSIQSRPSPRVRISSQMYQDDDDDDDDDDEEETDEDYEE